MSQITIYCVLKFYKILYKSYKEFEKMHKKA